MATSFVEEVVMNRMRGKIPDVDIRKKNRGLGASASNNLRNGACIN